MNNMLWINYIFVTIRNRSFIDSSLHLKMTILYLILTEAVLFSDLPCFTNSGSQFFCRFRHLSHPHTQTQSSFFASAVTL